MSPLISGLLSSIALPTVVKGVLLPNLGFLAWVSLIPLYLTLRKSRPVSALKAGLLFGLAYYGLSLYWIYTALHTYGEMPVWASLLAVSAVVMSLSLFSAAAAWLAVTAQRGNVSLLLSFPLSWVAVEFARAHFPFGGFPWSNLAYTQRSFLILLQGLDLTGIYGILFLILLCNTLIGEIWLWGRRRKRFPVTPAAIFACLFSLAIAYGFLRLSQVRRDLASRESIRISLVQGNIPQDEKWLVEKVEEIIARHLVMSEEAEKKEKPDLIIWPEAAYPAVIPPEIVDVEVMKGIKTPLLMGVVTYQGTIPEIWPPKPPESPESDDETFRLFNGAALIEPGGFIAGWYHKNHLVPMGEYVPLGRWLSSVSQIVTSITSFTPGRGTPTLTLPREGGGGENQFGVTICYEDLFPEISRTFTRQGADFLVNLTNDAWYDDSSAIFQHLDFSRYRAIENRRSMVRATNTGVTAFFSPTGEMTSSAPAFQESVLTDSVVMGGPGSIYTRFGDWFAWCCVIGFGLLVGISSLRQRRSYEP